MLYKIFFKWVGQYVSVFKSVIIIMAVLFAVCIVWELVLCKIKKQSFKPNSRSFLKKSFLIYIIAIYLLIILPFPDNPDTLTIDSYKPVFMPFNSLYQWILSWNIKEFSYKIFIRMLTDDSLSGMVYNVVLFMPYGMYMKHVFKLSEQQAVLTGMSLSIFFEVTQLTGLYGIYRYPYRTFEIDDIIFNVIGVVVAYEFLDVFLKIVKEKLNRIRR